MGRPSMVARTSVSLAGILELGMAKNEIRIDLARKVFAADTAFGKTGPYERLLGKVHFAIDPAEPRLPWICDLDLAPRKIGRAHV